MAFEYTVDRDAGRIRFVFPIPVCERVKDRISNCFRQHLKDEAVQIRWVSNNRINVTARRVGKADNILCIIQFAEQIKKVVSRLESKKR